MDLSLIPFELSKEAISKCYEDSDLNEVLDRAEKLMEKIKIQTSQVDWTSMIYDFHLEKSFYEDCIDSVQDLDQFEDQKNVSKNPVIAELEKKQKQKQIQIEMDDEEAEMEDLINFGLGK